MKHLKLFITFVAIGFFFIHCSKSKITNFSQLSESLAPQQTQAFALFDFEQDETLENLRKVYINMILENPVLAQLLPKEFDKDLAHKILSPKKLSVLLWPKGNNLSILPKDKTPNEIPFNFLVVTKMNHAKEIQDFLDNKFLSMVNEKGKVEYVKETKGDLSLYHPKDTKKVNLYMAIRGDVAILTSTFDSLMMGVDRLNQGKEGLSNNARYQDHKKKYFKDAMSYGYLDLASLIGTPESFKQMPAIQKAIQAIKSLVFTITKQDNFIYANYKLVADPQQGGAVLQKFLQPNVQGSLQSQKMIGQNHDYYLAFDLNMLYKMIYDAMGEVPQYAILRDMPQLRLKSMGLDFQKDILDAITGEIAVSGNYLKFMTGYMQTMATVMQQFGQTYPTSPLTPTTQTTATTTTPTPPAPPSMPPNKQLFVNSVLESAADSVLLIGITDVKKIEKLISLVGGNLLASLPVQDIQGAQFRCIPEKFCLGFHNNYMIVAASLEGATNYIKQIQASSKYQDSKVYKMIANKNDKKLIVSLFNVNWADPAWQKIMTQMAEMSNQIGGIKSNFNPTNLMTDFYKKFGEMWFQLSIEPDGILARSVIEIKP